MRVIAPGISPFPTSNQALNEVTRSKMMESKRSLVSSTLIPIVLLAVLLIALFAFSSWDPALGTAVNPLDSGTSSQVNSIVKEKPNRFPYGVSNLKGASPEEIGRFAQEYAQANGLVWNGTPTVLLSIPITRDAYTALGLGCLPDFAAIEQPPLALVILKGNLEFPSSGLIQTQSKRASGAYAGYVFDIWSARPVALDGSYTGGMFRKALKDPSLPASEDRGPTVCPTQIPSSKKTMHYGDFALGFTTPPPLPEDVTSNLAPPTTATPTPQSIPPAVATETTR
jgi:hypothetical protein